MLKKLHNVKGSFLNDVTNILIYLSLLLSPEHFCTYDILPPEHLIQSCVLLSQNHLSYLFSFVTSFTDDPFTRRRFKRVIFFEMTKEKKVGFLHQNPFIVLSEIFWRKKSSKENNKRRRYPTTN